MSIHKLLNKSVRFSLSANAKARMIWEFTVTLDPIFSDLYSCYVEAKNWNDLSPVQRIEVESKWTKSVLKLLAIGNRRIMHSICYQLREQTPEEDEEGNAV